MVRARPIDPHGERQFAADVLARLGGAERAVVEVDRYVNRAR